VCDEPLLGVIAVSEDIKVTLEEEVEGKPPALHLHEVRKIINI
jgi:hypothetical protein